MTPRNEEAKAPHDPYDDAEVDIEDSAGPLDRDEKDDPDWEESSNDGSNKVSV